MPRKPAKKHANQTNVYVRLPDPVYQELVEAAHGIDRSLASTIRQAISWWLKIGQAKSA